MLHAIKYVVWLVGQVFAGAFAIAVDVCRKETKMEPIMVEYPLRVTAPWQIAGFTTSITMTPGTLSCGTIPPDNEGDPTILLVQAVYGTDPAEVIAGLADMEQRLCPEVGDIDHGAPGQGSGDPLHSTMVAGHSDDDIGPTETDGHHVRTAEEQPHGAHDSGDSNAAPPGDDRPGDLDDVYPQSTPTGRSLTENTGPFDSGATITGHAAAIAGTPRNRLAGPPGDSGDQPLAPDNDPLAEVHDREPDVDGPAPETTPTDGEEHR